MTRLCGARRVPTPFLLALVLLTGCATTVSGVPSVPLPPGVVGRAQVSDIVGATLEDSSSGVVPPPPIEVDPADCAVAAGPSSAAVYTEGWTQFGLVTMQESASKWDHSVTQTIGRYPSSEAAAKVIAALRDGLAKCADVHATSIDPLDDSTSEWSFRVDQSNADAVRWTATQLDTDSWGCFRNARVEGNWVLQVGVCQFGNGQPAAAAILDALAANVKSQR